MKKSKLILAAILLSAALGSIVAANVKAKRGAIIYTGPTINAPCPFAAFNKTLTNSGGDGTFATTVYNAPCIPTFTAVKN
jgi:hypothetical protein